MIRLFFSYFSWHYGRSIRELLNIQKNIIWFLYHFFSLPILVRTFFSPWRAMGEAYEHKDIFHIGEMLSSFAVNTMMRIVGIFVRSIIILFGSFFIVSSIILAVGVLVFWLFIPFIILLLFISGLKIIISS